MPFKRFPSNRIGAAVHQQQALVLINKGNATGLDVVKLAHHIRIKPWQDKFGVYLRPEVRFMGANGEVEFRASH